jgi:dTDP-4-dehydrorhamnose reductase
MIVLVTGANGQLGSEIRALSSRYPYQYIFTDVQELDITNFADVRQIISDRGVSFIINCAAYTAVDRAESEPDIAKAINVDAVKNLAIVSNESDIPLIHISTDFVFDGIKTTPYIESDEPNPLSVYGATKLEGEREIQRLSSCAVIIRTSWLYSGFGGNFVKTIMRLGKERDNIGVVYDQIGTPTYAADLAGFILDNLPVMADIKHTEVFHYSNEGVASWYDFAKAIFELADFRCKVKAIETTDYPTPAKRPPYSVLSKSKVKKDFNAEISYWRDSLRKCISRLKS